MGSWGVKGVRSGDPGVPGSGGFHRWCELHVVGVLGTDARIVLCGCDDGLRLAVAALVELVESVFGGQQGSDQTSSIVVQYVDRQSW